MSRSFETIDIGMATYHREQDLPELLPLLLAQAEATTAATGREFGFRVVVVDNDPDGGARAVVEAFADPRVHYVVEPRPGVTAARNRALAEASGTDLLAFIDDDEIPHDDWLAQLVGTYLGDPTADAVAGPVYPVFDADLDPWVQASGIYGLPHRSHLRTGERVRRAGSGNLLLDLRTVRRLGITFDERFGLTGGEDSFFTGQLTKAGARIIWCAEAVADHRVPLTRANRSYTLQRRFSLSNAGVRADVLLADPGLERVGVRGKWLVTCLASLVKGVLGVVAGRLGRSDATTATGEIRVRSALGGLAGALGAAAKPYERPSGANAG